MFPVPIIFCRRCHHEATHSSCAVTTLPDYSDQGPAAVLDNSEIQTKSLKSGVPTVIGIFIRQLPCTQPQLHAHRITVQARISGSFKAIWNNSYSELLCSEQAKCILIDLSQNNGIKRLHLWEWGRGKTWVTLWHMTHDTCTWHP